MRCPECASYLRVRGLPRPPCPSRAAKARLLLALRQRRGRAISGLAQEAPRGHGDNPERTKRIMPDFAQVSGGTQDYVGDPRNDSVLISVNGALTPRAEAKVSVFDSGFVLGDGVWEGLRLVDGHIAFLERHFDRLWDGAKMLRIDLGLSREALKRRLFDVVEANGMSDGVHIRLMATRGVKRSPYQDPR